MILNELEDRLIAAYCKEQQQLMEVMDAEQFAWYLAHDEVIDEAN